MTTMVNSRILRMRATLRTGGEPGPALYRLNVLWRQHAALRASSRNAADQHVEERREDETEEGHAEHPREDGDTHHVPHLGAGAAREYQRHHTHDEGKRRHEDGTQ